MITHLLERTNPMFESGPIELNLSMTSTCTEESLMESLLVTLLRLGLEFKLVSVQAKQSTLNNV